MKKSDIALGNAYTDGKGNVRKVIGVGPQFVLYDGQSETDNLRYEVVLRKTGTRRVGTQGNSTRASFASWAKANHITQD
ncbi:MAG: hypothetical protein ACRER5_16300 [Pseudomonas sp.]